MILSEHNFCSIVPTVEKGRTIYSGIQKFVAFIMSVKASEAMQIFSGFQTGFLRESAGGAVVRWAAESGSRDRFWLPCQV